MTQALKDLGDYIAAALPNDVLETEVNRVGELTITVRTPSIVKVMTFLRDDTTCLFKQVVDVCGVDYPAREQRFDVVYHLLSMKHNQRLRVKVQTDEDTAVPSITGVFNSAGWFERETWDMYGVVFSDHPDLRRIPPITGSRGIRCARTSRSPAMWNCATTKSRSAASTSR